MTIGSGIAIAGTCASIAATAIWAPSPLGWMALSVLAFVAGFLAARR
jgi:hypothetical protein